MAKFLRPQSTVVTAEAILGLLFRQNFTDSKHWNWECKQVCDAFDEYGADPSNVLPDASKWLSRERPQWPTEESQSFIDPEGDSKGQCGEFDLKFSTPLWGWLALASWQETIEVQGKASNIARLFEMLVKCGNATSAAINAIDGSGHTLFQRASIASTIATELLWDEPNLLGLSPRPCLWCHPLRHATNFSGYVSEKRVLNLLGRMDYNDRHLAISDHKWLLHAAHQNLSHVFSALWAVVHQSSHKNNQTEKNSKDFKSTLLEKVSAHCLSSADYNRKMSLLTIVALDTTAGFIWERFTTSFLSTGFLQKTVTQTGMEYISPLCAALCGSRSSINTRDRRGAWLVPRLSSEHLNRYHVNGKTAMMIAVERCCPLTLAALLRRAPEVDLLARVVVDLRPEDPEDIGQVPKLPNDKFRFGAMAMELIPDVSSKNLPPTELARLNAIFEELRIKTQWQRDVYLPQLAIALLPWISKSTKSTTNVNSVTDTATGTETSEASEASETCLGFPVELVAICYGYVGLVLPTITTATTPTLTSSTTCALNTLNTVVAVQVAAATKEDDTYRFLSEMMG